MTERQNDMVNLRLLPLPLPPLGSLAWQGRISYLSTATTMLRSLSRDEVEAARKSCLTPTMAMRLAKDLVNAKRVRTLPDGKYTVNNYVRGMNLKARLGDASGLHYMPNRETDETWKMHLADTVDYVNFCERLDRRYRIADAAKSFYSRRPPYRYGFSDAKTYEKYLEQTKEAIPGWFPAPSAAAAATATENPPPPLPSMPRSPMPRDEEEEVSVPFPEVQNQLISIAKNQHKWHIFSLEPSAFSSLWSDVKLRYRGSDNYVHDELSGLFDNLRNHVIAPADKYAPWTFFVDGLRVDTEQEFGARVGLKAPRAMMAEDEEEESSDIISSESSDDDDENVVKRATTFEHTFIVVRKDPASLGSHHDLLTRNLPAHYITPLDVKIKGLSPADSKDFGTITLRKVPLMATSLEILLMAEEYILTHHRRDVRLGIGLHNELAPYLCLNQTIHKQVVPIVFSLDTTTL